MTHARLTNRMRALLVALLGLIALAGSGAPARAQPSGGDNIRVTLVADGKPVAGKPWTLALHFVPKSAEWHGYWKNPGDAGAGMRLDWTLPAGWQAGEPQYPVPKVLEIAGLANHVFGGEYAVLVPVTVLADADPARAPPIALTVDYLACTDQICVPERADLTLDPAAAVKDPRFDTWRAAIAPLLDQPAHFAIEDEALRLAIPLPADLPVSNPHVFIEPHDLVNYGAVQSFSRQGDWLIAEVPLAGTAVTTNPVTGIIALGDGNGVRFRGEPGAVPKGGTPLEPAAAATVFWIALLGAFVGGLLLNIMPCVFPILSLKALALARAGGEEKQAQRDALAYTAGVVIACLALGAVMLALRAGGEQVGWAFQLQQPGVVTALLVLAVAITASFLGVFELPSLGISGGGSVFGGSFLTGLLAAFVATPCTGPFMAAALGAALLLPAAEALVLFAALGLGLALPFLLLGFVPALRRIMPRPGAWMVTFRRIMAIPMALTVLALAWLAWRLGGLAYLAGAAALAAIVTALLHMLWGSHGTRSTHRAASLGALGAIALGLLVGLPMLYAPPAAHAEAGLLDAKPFSEAALAEARAAGHPVFVWFTADWCLTCKVNERAAIEREATRDVFRKAGVVVLRGDWTRRDEAITRFLTAQGAAGVPLYLWYPAKAPSARQLPQVLTPGLLAGLANGTG